MAFDIVAAKKEGYTDSEIADYLASEKGFDTKSARKEGYSDAEIIQHLGNQQKTPNLMDKLDKIVATTPGLREAGKAADYLGFGKMAQGIQGIPGAIAGIPSAAAQMVGEAVQDPRTLIPTGRDVVGVLPLAAGLFASPILGPGASIPARMIATALGTGGGEAARSGIEGQPLAETARNVAGAFVAGGIGEGASPIASRTTEKILSPFASKLSPEAARVAETAAAKNLPLSPSSINPTKTAKAFEWVSDKFLPGKWWAGKKKEQLSKGIQGMFEETVENIPIKTDKTQAGLTLKKALDKETYYGQFFDELTDIANKSGETAKGFPVILMDETSQIIGELKGKSFGQGGDVLHSWFAGLEKEGTSWTPETVKKYSSLINSKLRQMAGNTPLNKVPVNDWVEEGGNTVLKETGKTLEDVRMQLFEALKTDVKEAWPAFQKAKDFYTVFGPQAIKKSPFLQNIVRQSKNAPYRVVDDIFRSKDFESVDMLQSELKKVDPKAWETIQGRFVENIFDTSIVQTADEAGQMFSPGKYVKNFERYSDVIKKYMPESYNNMKQLADISKASLKDLSKKPPDLMDLAFSGGLSGGGGGLSAVNPILGAVGVAVPNGFSFIMAKSMLNPKGIVKKWLTTGIDSPLVREMAKQSPKAISLKFSEQE